MCKVMMIAGIKPGKIESVHKLAKVMSKNMSKREEDGVGYAAITKQGKIYGEKWLNKDDAFTLRGQPKPDPIAMEMNEILGEMAEWESPPLTGKPVYERFGVNRTPEVVSDTVAVILHARKATTGDKVLQNVHPFFQAAEGANPDTALIHNGGIHNHDKLVKKMSTCDSEVLLHEYLGNNMYVNPWGIENLARTVTGVYAVGVLSSQYDPNGEFTPVLDIFKYNKELHACYVNELETVVFSTDKGVMEESFKECEMTFKNMVKIKDSLLLRVDAVTGKRIELIPFKAGYFGHGYTGGEAHENSAARSQYPKSVVGPAARSQADSENDGITETASEIDTAKTHFERRHPGLFITPYAEKPSLNQLEKEFFQTLGSHSETNHKALHLVKAALSDKIG